VLDSVEAVERALAARGHNPQRLAIRSFAELLDGFKDNTRPDVVFNLFEGFGGVGRGEAEVAGLVELAGFPLTGSPAASLSLVRDKPRTKWLLAGAGVPTAPFELIPTSAEIDRTRLIALLDYGAVIVKPAHEDGSLGIGPESIVDAPESLMRQIEHVQSRYGAVLVERFIAGREFNAAIVDFGQPEVLPLAEIDFQGGEHEGWQIVTYDAKWSAGSEADRNTPSRCPAVVDEHAATQISQIALEAFRLCGCRGYARVDLRLDAQGNAYVLEVNANPDIGPGTGFRKTLSASGMAFENFIDRLVTSAVRHLAF
jgi:D-alanine-D-alanine ligase